MSSKFKGIVDPFEAPIHKVRSPEGKVESLAPAAASILIRKAGYVDENEFQALKKAKADAETAVEKAVAKDAK